MVAMIGRGLVAAAFEMVRPRIEDVLVSGVTNRSCLAVAVTGLPCLNPLPAGKSFEDGCYLVAELGDRAQFEPRFRRMAISKAEISVRTGLATSEVPPHLLLEGDTTSWGSVVLDGLVVACCGVQSYNDEMFSMWIASAIKAKAKEAMSGYPPDRKFI